MGYFETLQKEIITRSEPRTLSFIEAKDQWSVRYKCKVSYNDNVDCLCGYKNIVNINYLMNAKTSEMIVVGSCCVKQFEFKDLEVRCIECSKLLSNTNKYVQSLLENGVKISKKTKVVGHKKCCEKIRMRIQLLYKQKRDYFTCNAKEVVLYFGGGISSIWDKPEGVEISYRSEYEDYLNLVTGLDLQ